MKIKDAVILITGASSGIGAATASAAAKRGARVVLLARRKARIESLAAELGNALAVECDVTAPDQINLAVQAAIDHFGRIDVLINNAGQGMNAAVEEINIPDFRALLELNLIAPLTMMQAVVPSMVKQAAGTIINISSGATLATYPGSAAYTSAKAGLNMLSAVARLELATAGITVSTLHPFITATEFYQKLQTEHNQAKEQDNKSAVVMHSPERVAQMILKLIESGEAQSDLVPEAYGGSYRE